VEKQIKIHGDFSDFTSRPSGGVNDPGDVDHELVGPTTEVKTPLIDDFHTKTQVHKNLVIKLTKLKIGDQEADPSEGNDLLLHLYFKQSKARITDGAKHSSGINIHFSDLGKWAQQPGKVLLLLTVSPSSIFLDKKGLNFGLSVASVEARRALVLEQSPGVSSANLVGSVSTWVNYWRARVPDSCLGVNAEVAASNHRSVFAATATVDSALKEQSITLKKKRESANREEKPALRMLPLEFSRVVAIFYSIISGYEDGTKSPEMTCEFCGEGLFFRHIPFEESKSRPMAARCSTTPPYARHKKCSRRTVWRTPNEAAGTQTVGPVGGAMAGPVAGPVVGAVPVGPVAGPVAGPVVGPVVGDMAGAAAVPVAAAAAAGPAVDTAVVTADEPDISDDDISEQESESGSEVASDSEDEEKAQSGDDFTSEQPISPPYNTPLQQAPAKAPVESHHCYVSSEDFEAEKSAAEREFPFLGGLTDMKPGDTMKIKILFLLSWIQFESREQGFLTQCKE
jgi:hypothetical protein